jgi:hypothetical protein
MGARIRIAGEHLSTAARPFGTKHERTNWLRNAYFQVPFHNLLFFYLAFARLGILDGTNGVRYSFVRAMIRSWNDLKVAEHRATGRMPSVEPARTGAVHPVVAASALQAFVDSCREANAVAPCMEFPWRKALQSL